ncbi:MAG TPA: divergent polysaccharide deacetylase family protein [Rhizomicrobium sp.]|nr:divergent polysaccharide deacetylase family protein [Rhizomicrobium sp.]
MLRLKPIRKSKRRGPSREVLRIADGAFWIVLVFAVAFGAGRLATGFPNLLGLFVSPGAIAAQADIAPVEPIVRMSIAPDDVPAMRMTIATDDIAAAASPVPSGPPTVAIVIDDLGADAIHTRRAIALPKQVALSFLPYPQDTPRLAREASRAGHEILVHLPMEALGPQNPGPNALMIAQAPEENVRRLDWALSRVPGFIGVNNHEGSRFTSDHNALAPVMEALVTRHVFFLDSKTTAESQVASVAFAYGVTSAARDVFLDDVDNIDAIAGALRTLERKAKEQGVAIAIGHPRESTLDAIAYWAAHTPGIKLVRLSEAIRLKAPKQNSLALLRR